jgi:hypothetical protein
MDNFAFRFMAELDADEQTYELIDNASGQALMTVAESNNEIGPSARFDMEVLWRPDSKAFALTAMLWKRGSSVKVFVRDGSAFREINIPDLSAEIPEKVKKGQDYPHVSQLNSETAKRWQKDGSLLVEITNSVDGTAGTITATRAVVLGFNKSKKAKVLKSQSKFAVDNS